MRLNDADLEILKKLKTGSTWSSLKSIKVINDKIKNLKIYEKSISKKCIEYLKNDVVKSKTFLISTMLEKCIKSRNTKKINKKEPKGKYVKIGKDAKTGVAKTTLETNTIKGKAIPSSRKQTIIRNAGKIYDAINRANGDPKKTIELLGKDKKLIKETTEGFEEALFAVISYFITDKQLANSIFVISTSILTFLAKLYGKKALEWILGKLYGVAKKLKKKGYKYFGFGDGDDDDDDDDDNNSGNSPQLNLDDDIANVLMDIENFDLDDYGNKPDDKKEPELKVGDRVPTNSTIATPNSMSSDSQTLQFLKQQAQQNYQSELAQARQNTDILLRTEPTTQKHTETQSAKPKEPTSFKTDGEEYFKYDNVDKFKERYDNDMKDLRKEDEYKTFSDDDFYNKYNEKFKEKTKGEDLDEVFKGDKHPIKKPSVEPLTQSNDITSVNRARVYDDMGRELETGVGHTTPPSFWETLQNFSPTQPLGAVAGAMALGGIGASMIGRSLLPEAQQRTPQQMNAISRFRQPRQDGISIEPILERGGRVDRYDYDDMPNLIDTTQNVSPLMRTNQRGESADQSFQTLVPESGAGEFRERELGLGRPLAKFKERYPAGSLSGRTPPQRQALSRTTSTSSNIMGLDLASREEQLFKKLDDWRGDIRKEEKRSRDIERQIARLEGVDIPHSHEQELALERAGRVQREGQYLVPETPVVRPSTTLTQSLIQDNQEMLRELGSISDEMTRLMGVVNEPSGDDI